MVTLKFFSLDRPVTKNQLLNTRNARSSFSTTEVAEIVLRVRYRGRYRLANSSLAFCFVFAFVAVFSKL